MENLFVFVAFLSIFTFIFSLYFEVYFWELLSYIFYLNEEYNTDVSSEKNSDFKTILFIGITSSPDHFRQRRSLRETWLNLLPSNFQYSFLVGKEDCKMHPLDRKSYSCEDLNFLIPENTTEESVFSSNSVNLPDSCNNKLEENIGFSFQVHHPIEVKFLGIKKRNLSLNKDELAKVVLSDFRTSEEIASVTLHRESLQDISIKTDYIFKRLISPVILPKGFEGVIAVKGVVGNFQGECCKDSAEWTHGNLFSVLNVITEKPNQTSINYCGLSIFNFTIKDFDKLNSHIREKQSRLSEWAQHIQETRKQLQYEAEYYKDIIFLDLVDVYRNLPKKLLLFLKWVHANVETKYVLKTDDDTFIDINRVKIELASSSGWDWWSCFRIGWPVQRHGKWRETAYQQKIYPPFPSGAGYILSEHVLSWINERVENLSTNYQGEDVAVGIWLEEMNASRHVGTQCYWACNKQCHANTCNAMELSVYNVYKMWGDFSTCGNKICHCPEPS